MDTQDPFSLKDKVVLVAGSLMLVSRAGGFITGQNIAIDGVTVVADGS